jgi:coenzyme F420-reducing hydrogenase beta subunit
VINITKKEECAGCYACVNICPQNCIIMKTDIEGFWYPVVEVDKCTNCNLCDKVCPIINKHNEKNEPLAYSCFNKNEEIRLKSSSGGIFTLIAEEIIAKGGIVFGARFDSNFKVIHDFVDNVEDLELFVRSKYVQSKIGETYKIAKNYLKEGRRVLFSGTPCQIAGLKSFLMKDYNNLLTIDLFCHGVPSPKVWEKYVAHMENSVGSKMVSVSFRSKEKGWKLFSMSANFENGFKHSEPLNEDLYLVSFLKDLSLRPSCYNCQFKGINRISDITLADFWGVENILPDMDDDRGTSLILINTGKGHEMFQKIKSKMLYKEVNLDKAVLYNPNAITSVRYNPKRDKFFQDLDQFPFDQIVKKYSKETIFAKVIKKIKGKLKSLLKKFNIINLT